MTATTPEGTDSMYGILKCPQQTKFSRCQHPKQGSASNSQTYSDTEPNLLPSRVEYYSQKL